MAQLLGIMGEPGTGKSTSLKSLPPEETYYCDCDGKGLNWRGWREQYNDANKNYLKSSFPQVVLKYMDNIAEKAPHIHYFVIDTMNNLMVSDEMRRCKEKGYDKWMDLAACVWDMVDRPSTYRDDLTIILLFHTQTEMTDFGYEFTRIKTNGRKTEKNNIDSKFNWLLRSVKQDDKYYFETTAHNSTARTPLEAFDKEYIPNDIMEVIEVMKEF
ncbi:MAG: ATP-binding protein [Lachnospiraceae bacterium]|nr:ATP-binding protein [Lachnospiraceae bacterium]